MVIQGSIQAIFIHKCRSEAIYNAIVCILFYDWIYVSATIFSDLLRNWLVVCLLKFPIIYLRLCTMSFSTDAHGTVLLFLPLIGMCFLLSPTGFPPPWARAPSLRLFTIRVYMQSRA